MTRYVYPLADGGREMADLLGGKGANLAEMTRLGLPVPPASPSPPRRAGSIWPRARSRASSLPKSWAPSPSWNGASAVNSAAGTAALADTKGAASPPQ